MSSNNSQEPFNTYSQLLDRTAKRVKQYAQNHFNEQSFGITVDQWSILKILKFSSCNLSQKELAEQCEKDQASLTRIVDILVNKKLVEREINPQDRRSFVIHLTSEGNKKVEEIYPKIAEMRLKAWENLAPSDFEDLKRILNTIYTNLQIEDSF